MAYARPEKSAIVRAVIDCAGIVAGTIAPQYREVYGWQTKLRHSES